MVLAVITYFAVLLVGLAAAMPTCDDGELHRAACTKAGFWWASTGSVYLQLGGAGVAILGAWVWPRRVRWVWIGGGCLMVLTGFMISFAILRL